MNLENIQVRTFDDRDKMIMSTLKRYRTFSSTALTRKERAEVRIE